MFTYLAHSLVLQKEFCTLTEAQSILSKQSHDDNVEVLSTFDLNRIASLTFGEVVSGEMFDVIE